MDDMQKLKKMLTQTLDGVCAIVLIVLLHAKQALNMLLGRESNWLASFFVSLIVLLIVVRFRHNLDKQTFIHWWSLFSIISFLGILLYKGAI